MTTSIRKFAFAALAVGIATIPASAQAPVRPETSLVGVKLYDNGYKIVSIYGSPDDVQPLTIGGGAIGGGGGGAPGGISAPGARGGFGGPGQGAPSSPLGGAAAASSDSINPWSFGDDVLRQFGPPGGGQGQPGGISAPGGRGGGPSAIGGGPSGPPGGFGGGGPGIPGGPPAGLGGPGAGGLGGGGGTTAPVTFTRWIYNRNGSKYGFILDKFSRVVQIEAIGLSNPKARTTRGIGFGSSFAQIIKAYRGFSPDGYEINGNTIVVRFLSRHRVAYRLTRLGQNKPHVVTGIVVAAGKG